MRGDQRAGNHGLARTERSDEYAQVVAAQSVHSLLLWTG